FIFPISNRETADLEPSVNPIRATAAVLNLIDLSRFDRFFARLNYSWKVITVNRVDQSPVLQLFIGLTEIFQGLSVEKFDFAQSARCGHKPRNIVDDLPPGEFSRTQGFLSPLAILNVYTGSVKFEDVARFIPQRVGANEEPSIGTVETAN